MQTILADKTTVEWQAMLDAADIPCSPVNTIAEAMQLPIVAERGMVQHVQHPVSGTIPLVRTPLRFTGAFEDVAMAPPPLLGEHTEDILTGLLGYSAADADALRQAGAVAFAAVRG